MVELGCSGSKVTVIDIKVECKQKCGRIVA